MNSPVPASPHAERLLVEILCRREEAAGHPADSEAADLGAIRAGGDLAQRIRTRALRLPGSDLALVEIDRVLGLGRVLAIALLVFAALAGITAARAALGDGRGLSIPLILLALVGVNVFMLLVWMAAQAARPRAPVWLETLWRVISRRFGATRGSGDAGLDAIRVLTQGPGARWRFGVLLHGAWLTYTGAGLATLTLLLVVRRFELDWQTTLLSAEGLRALAEGLSVVPRLLGAAGPDQLSLTGALDANAHRGWAAWLLIAVLAYGLAPRLVALGICALLSSRTQPRWQRELSRPGYARLRDRLMPDRRERMVVDPDRPVPATEAPAIQSVVDLPSEPLHGVLLEWPDTPELATSTRWRWFGEAHDETGRAKALSVLRADPVTGLVVIVRATATPDRGLQRFVAELATAARAPAWIALGDLPRLEARGASARAVRIADWERLAISAGVGGGLLGWNEAQGTVGALPA